VALIAARGGPCRRAPVERDCPSAPHAPAG